MKKPKSEVNYSRGHKDSHCGPVDVKDEGYCAHFVENDKPGFVGSGKCRKVVGPIGRVYWCQLWRKHD